MNNRILYLQTFYNGYIEHQQPVPASLEALLRQAEPHLRLLKPTHSWPTGMLTRFSFPSLVSGHRPAPCWSAGEDQELAGGRVW